MANGAANIRRSLNPGGGIALGNFLIQHAEVITQTVQFAKMAFDRGPLVIRYRLAGGPSMTDLALTNVHRLAVQDCRAGGALRPAPRH